MKLKKNLIYQFSYQLLAILLPLITAPYVSRVLGADALGEYAYTYTVAYYFYVLCMLGFDTYGQRRIAATLDDLDERNRAFSETITLQVLVTLAGCAVYICYAFQVAGETRALTLLQFIYLASVFTNIVWVFEGVEEFRAVSIRNSVVKIASTALIFALVRTEGDLWVYTLIIAGSAFAGNLLFFVDARKYVRFVPPKPRAVTGVLKPAALLFVPQVGITVFMQVDKLMLGWWSTPAELGYYQYAEKIVSIPIALILTVGVVMMPRIISLNAENDPESVKRYNSLCMEALMLVGIAFTAGIAAVSPVFTPWFFGEGFYGCVPILTLLSLQVAFMAWENVLQKQYLIPLGRDKVVVRAMGIAAIINVALNVVLIPAFSAVGAIFGSLACHLFICVYEGAIVRYELNLGRYVSFVVAYGACGAAMFFLVRLFAAVAPIGDATMLFLSEAAVGVLSYCTLAYCVMRVRGSELIPFLSKAIAERSG